MNKYFDNTTYIILLILFLIIFITIRCSRMAYIRNRKKGMEGELKTNKILLKYAKSHHCCLLTNVLLPLYDGTCEIDHILFGKFGAVVIETKNISGELSGDGKQLLHKIGRKEYHIYNPKLQNETHVKNVRHHLNAAGLNDVPIYSFVVFTSKDIRFPENLGITLSMLEGSLKRLPDNKCKYRQCYKAIKKAKVLDPLQKLKHNLEVNRNKQISK